MKFVNIVDFHEDLLSFGLYLERERKQSEKIFFFLLSALQNLKTIIKIANPLGGLLGLFSSLLLRFCVHFPVCVNMRVNTIVSLLLRLTA